MLQVGLGAADRPQVVTFAQHSWRQGCGWPAVEHAGAAPVAYVAHASHATYPRRGTHDRPWPDPNDEARGDGAWTAPAAFHDRARVCASGPPGHPWWAFAGLGGLVLLAIAAILRRRTSPAC